MVGAHANKSWQNIAWHIREKNIRKKKNCLLYTSDAADE